MCGEAGCGSFGRVLLAVARGKGVMHALKFVEPDRGDPKQEADILASLDHPNVTKLLAVFTPHLPKRLSWVLAMPAADTDLAMFMAKRGKRVDRLVAQSLAQQLAKGLGYTHFQGVIHRDIKPANLLLTFHPSRDAGLVLWLRVADFGMARRLKRHRARIKVKEECNTGMCPLMAPQTMTAHVVTSWYRPPELLLLDEVVFRDGDVRYGCSLDVWSYGCVVYELLAGRVLCEARLVADMLARVLAVLGPPPQKMWDDMNFVQWKDRLPPPSTSLPPLVVEDLAWDVVHATLRWVPEERVSLTALLSKSKWLAGVPQVAAEAPATPRGTTSAMSETAPTTVPKSMCDTFVCAPDTPVSTWTSPHACACKGHCLHHGHQWHGCPTTVLVEGSDRCLECICSICLRRPRNDSDLCYKDRAAVIKQLSPPLRLARASRDLARELLPCDLVDFVQLYPTVCHDFALVILIALIKDGAGKIPPSCGSPLGHVMTPMGPQWLHVLHL